MTTHPDVTPTREGLEELVARVRARLARVCAHLDQAFAGRGADLLYSWGGDAITIVIPDDFEREWTAASHGEKWSALRVPASQSLSLSARPNFDPTSPQGAAYRAATSEWPLPGVALNVVRHRLATMPAEALADTLARGVYGIAADDPHYFAAVAEDVERIDPDLYRHLHESGALAMQPLPLRMTIAEGLTRLAADADDLAAVTAAEIHDGLLALEPRKLRTAVGAREELVARWPWPRTRHPAARVLAILIALTDPPPPGELLTGAWPPDVAPLAVATWAKGILGRKTADAAALLEAVRDGRFVGRYEWTALAVLFSAWQSVERDRQTPVIRHSATKAGRAALSVIAAGPGSIGTAHPWRPGEDFAIAGSVVELVWDGRRTPVQLRLDITDDHARLDYMAVRGILHEIHEDGLRDWLILHRMAGEQGATGVIRWTWPDHKAITSYARQVTLGKATDAELAAETVRRLWQLKRAEIRLYAPRAAPDGSTPWVRVGPGGLLDIPAGAIDPAGRDRLVVIKLNPEIYAGARRDAPSQHFMLLAQTAVNLPGPALRLLSLIGCDWQYERAPGGITRAAATLWDYAAIRDGRCTPRKRWPDAERTLERLLATLAEQDHLADWRRESGEGATRQYHLRPPQWWIDQAIFDVPPDFGKSLASTPRTGRELKVWREAHGWSHAELAILAGVGISTLKRAERVPVRPLSPRLAARLRPL